MEWGRLHCVTGSVALYGDIPYNGDNIASPSNLVSVVHQYFDTLKTTADLYG